MNHVGVFVDLSNLYYTSISKYNRKIDYMMFMDYCKEIGRVTIAHAYGTIKDKPSEKFFKTLEDAGFIVYHKRYKSYRTDTVTTRKADWDVGITIDIVKNIEKFNTIILGSADGDYVPLVEFLKDRGIRVIVLGCKISKQLKRAATHAVEIPQSLLYSEKTKCDS